MQSGFDKLPALAGNGSKLVQINSGGTAMAALALTVGALLFGGAAGVLGQDGANLFWDNTAKRLGIGNAAPTVALDVTGAGKFSTGLTVGTTLTASTSVVTSLAGPTTDVTFNLQVNGGNRWGIATSAGVAGAAAYTLFPLGDATQDFGSASTRIRNAFITIIDSGTTGSLSLRTNNGKQQALIVSVGDGTNFANIQGASTTFPPVIYSNGGDTNIGLIVSTKGSGSIDFATSGTFTGDSNTNRTTQFQVIHTASATSNARITGAAVAGTVGATLSTSDGRSLAITPAVVLASSLNFSTAAAKIIPGATSISLRNNADSADNLVIVDAGNATLRGSLAWGTGVANFGTVTRRKTADQSVISSTVLVNDNDLTFAIAANEEWVADCSVSCGANISSTGVKIAITAPAGATLEFDFYFIGDIGAIRVGGGRTTVSGTAVSFTAASFAGCTDAALYLNIWVLNGATPGNVTVQWAQGTSAAFNTTFRKGSHLQATRVG